MQFELLAPVPAVTLARKLRQIPLFRFVSVDELFRVSSISQQVRYDTGTSVQERGAKAEYIQVLLEGELELQDGHDDPELVKPPALMGFEEVMEGTTIRRGARARSESIALVMPAEEFRTLLSANIELAHGLFRMLLVQPSDDGAPSVRKTTVPPKSLPLDVPLKTVDKVLYLQTLPVLARATGDELYRLAAITKEVILEGEDLLFSEGHPSSIWLVLSGEIELESSDGTERAGVGAGDCLGVRETLAGTDWSWRARPAKPGKALQIEREALFELLGDHMDLLQGIFGGIFLEREHGKRDG